MPSRRTTSASLYLESRNDASDELLRDLGSPRFGADENDGTNPESNAVDRTALEIWEHDKSLTRSDPQQNGADEAAETELGDDSVRMYLREVGRVDLLTAREEVILARAIELAKWLEKIEQDTRGQDAPETAHVASNLLVAEILRRIGANARRATSHVI